MYRSKRVALVIPARNEARALPGVFRTVPFEVDRILIVDNGSSDDTARVAEEHGAEVVSEPIAGYGRACLAGLAALAAEPPDIVAFGDADGSDDLSRLFELLDPLVDEEVELALAMRIPIEAGALNFQQRFGNWLTTRLIRLFWNHDYRDLGPMRAITWEGLEKLEMSDQSFGWTVEMQVRALQMGLRAKEFPVSYLRRKAGRSKVSGTLAGSFRAGVKILWVIGREVLREKRLFPKVIRTGQTI